MLDVPKRAVIPFHVSRGSRSSIGPRFSANRNNRRLFPALPEVCFAVFLRLERRDLDICQQVCRQWLQLIRTYTACLDRRKLDVMKICLRNEFSFSIVPNSCDEYRRYTIIQSELTNEVLLNELRGNVSEYSESGSSNPESLALQSSTKCRWKNCLSVDTYDKCEVKHAGNVFLNFLQKYSSFNSPPEQYLAKLTHFLKVSSVHSLIFFECDLNEHIISDLLALLKLNPRFPTEIDKIIFHDVYIDATPRAIRLFQQLLFESFKVVHIVLDQVYCDVDEEMSLPWQLPDPLSDSTLLSSIKHFNVFCTLNTFDLPINSEITEMQLLNLMTGRYSDRFHQLQTLILGKVEISDEFINDYLIIFRRAKKLKNFIKKVVIGGKPKVQKITFARNLFQSRTFHCPSLRCNSYCWVTETVEDLTVEIKHD